MTFYPDCVAFIHRGLHVSTSLDQIRKKGCQVEFHLTGVRMCDILQVIVVNVMRV